MQTSAKALLTGVIGVLIAACNNSSPQLALGTLERDRIALRATTSEIIIAEPVAEGTQVTAGTLLVQLDTSQQQSLVARAKAEVARAEAALAELRNGARPEDVAAATARASGARATLLDAKASYVRAKQLRQQQLTAQADLDHALAARDAAQAALQAASEDLLRLTNGTRQEQLDQGAAALASARAQLALEQQKLADLSIVATRNARLDSLPWHVGERVTAGATVAILLADEAPYARVYVPEPWRSRLHVGDAMTVHVDGITEPLTGTLRWIATEPAFTPYYALNANDRSRLVYLAEFDIAGGTDLPTGMPAQVRLADD